MINIFSPLWLAPIKRGGRKCKIDIIYLQKHINIEGYNLDDVINLACFQNLKEKNGQDVVQNIC